MPFSIAMSSGGEYLGTRCHEVLFNAVRPLMKDCGQDVPHTWSWIWSPQSECRISGEDSGLQEAGDMRSRRNRLACGKGKTGGDFNQQRDILATTFANVIPVKKTIDSAGSHDVSGLDVGVHNSRSMQALYRFQQSFHDGFHQVEIFARATSNVLAASHKNYTLSKESNQ
jgi:hypothetical protein